MFSMEKNIDFLFHINCRNDGNAMYTYMSSQIKSRHSELNDDFDNEDDTNNDNDNDNDNKSKKFW